MRCKLTSAVLGILPELVVSAIVPLIEQEDVSRRVEQSVAGHQLVLGDAIAIVALEAACGEAGGRSLPRHGHISRAVGAIALVVCSLRVGDLHVDPMLGAGDHGCTCNTATAALDAALNFGGAGAVTRVRDAALGGAERGLHASSRAIGSRALVVSAAADVVRAWAEARSDGA